MSRFVGLALARASGLSAVATLALPGLVSAHGVAGVPPDLGMIVIVAVVMVLYALIQRRASRWVR